MLYSDFCRRCVRLHGEMYKCLYRHLEAECNATASAIYTTYTLICEKYFDPDCHISE